MPEAVAKPPLSRGVHIASALTVIVLGFITCWHWPDLVKDSVNTFGTIGILVTIYGVIFTIVEVIRVEASAVIAAKFAKEVAERVEALHDTRDAAECQILIEGALDRLKEESTLSSSTLARIVKLYTAEFAALSQQDTSVQRARINLVTSYAFSQSRTKTQALSNSTRLQTVLIEMIADVSASNTRRVHREP